MSSVRPSYTVPLAVAGLMGASCIFMNALGVYLKKRLNERQAKAWSTANQYQLTHTAALASVVGMMALPKSIEAQLYLYKAFYLIATGAACFSGSIYALCLNCPRWVGPITPTGGLILILGWVSVSLAALC